MRRRPRVVLAIFVLISVLFVVVRDLSTRALPLAVPAMVLTLATAVSVTIMGALLGFDERWSSPSWTVLAQLLAAAAFLSVGYLMIIAAMRLGDMSVIVPFRYSNVVFAIVLGVLVWGDIPDAVTIVGSAIIIATGLYTLYRERKVASARRPAAISGPMMRLPPNLFVMDRAAIDAYRARMAANPNDDGFDFRGVQWLGRERDISTAVSARAFRDVRNGP